MPKKGRLRAADRLRETPPDCVAARRQHPAVESAINHLNHRGLSLVRMARSLITATAQDAWSPVPGAHGKEGFDCTVGRVVVATNVHRLGQILKQQEVRRRQWH